MEIEAGDHVSADTRLVYAVNLQIQEAVLTGESTPVEKVTATLDNPETPLAGCRNLIFLGIRISPFEKGGIGLRSGHIC